MSLALAIDNDVRMPYIKFERVAVEDTKASQEAGHYVAKDVDFVHVTPAYSKDILKYKVSSWLEQVKIDAQNDRLPKSWAEHYVKAYEAFKNGQELPLNGTAIRGWGVISPAQQETLIRLHVLTIEQLAAITSEGMSRLGMGGLDLKNKAVAWLTSIEKNGKPTMELAKLKKENKLLKSNQESMEEKITALTAMVEAMKKPDPIGSYAEIDIED